MENKPKPLSRVEAGDFLTTRVHFRDGDMCTESMVPSLCHYFFACGNHENIYKYEAEAFRQLPRQIWRLLLKVHSEMKMVVRANLPKSYFVHTG